MTDQISYDSEFILIYEKGSLPAAAEELHISASSLARHMHLLEEELGHRLFAKMGSHVRLTEFGTLYLSFARRHKQLDTELSQAIRDFDARNGSSVRIAVAHTMNCDHIVNMLTDHFSDRHPEYSVAAGEFSRTLSTRQIFELGYELVFAAASSPLSDEYNCFPWSSDLLTAILPLSHPLAHEKQIHLSQLSRDKFILFPEGTFLNALSTGLCRKAGFEPMVDFTIHGTRNLAELVSAGIGVSLTTSGDIAGIRSLPVAVVPLSPPSPVFLNLYYRKDRPLSKAAETFLKYAIEIHDTRSADIPYQGPEGEVGNIFFT